MSRPDTTNCLTLTDYFDELNSNGGLHFSDIDFDYKYYDLDKIRDTPLASNSFSLQSSSPEHTASAKTHLMN